MRIVSIVGARPQFVKLAPLIREVERRRRSGDLEHLIVHTGQHYDAGLSQIFFDELGLPQPDFNLEVGSGPHGQQTGQMLEKVEQVLIRTAPAMVLVFGDTNSTLAGALAASKLNLPVGHIEAGLRSFNRAMPEEINRIVTDHVSDLLLAPTAVAMQHLTREGIGHRAVLTGDIMREAVLQNLAIAKRKPSVLEGLGVRPGEYGLVTLHRAENTDEAPRLQRLLDTLNTIATNELPLIFPLHPRTRSQWSARCPNWVAHPRLQIRPPLGYFDLLQLTQNARVTLTDSGGLQKEAFFLGCPCVTLREETEWTETLDGGGNVLAGADPERILASVAAWRERYPRGNADFSADVRRLFGTEHVSAAILQAVSTFLEQRQGCA